MESDYSMTVGRKEVDEWDRCLERVRDDFPVSVFSNWKNALVLYLRDNSGEEIYLGEGEISSAFDIIAFEMPMDYPRGIVRVMNTQI